MNPPSSSTHTVARVVLDSLLAPSRLKVIQYVAESVDASNIVLATLHYQARGIVARLERSHCFSIPTVALCRGIRFIENHEFDSVLGREGESTEAVSMGNDHSFNTSSVDAFQKGRKAFAGEVEAAGDVFAFTLEVVPLLVGGDSSVAAFRFRDRLSCSESPNKDWKQRTMPTTPRFAHLDKAPSETAALPLDGATRSIIGVGGGGGHQRERKTEREGKNNKSWLSTRRKLWMPTFPAKTAISMEYSIARMNFR